MHHAFILCVFFRLQSEGEHLEQWLQSVEGKAAKDEDLAGLLQEEPLKQR